MKESTARKLAAKQGTLPLGHGKDVMAQVGDPTNIDAELARDLGYNNKAAAAVATEDGTHDRLVLETAILTQHQRGLPNGAWNRPTR